ncbi:hypothetical protein, partial [Mycobacterium sp. 1245852.3]|uniref:hypothetical protein n=1 Tax=Mycobacterium sp. 1245852.3 TaxID=1856860 RepID=UPI001E572E28
ILDNFSLSIDGQDSSSLSLRESRTLTAAALTQECSRLLGAAASTLVGDMLWLSILTGVLSEYPTTSESPGFSVTGESNFGSMSTYLDSDEVCLRLGHYVAEFARRLSENSSSDEQHSENRAFIALILELAESQVVWAELPIKNKRSGSSMRVITEYSTRHLPEWGALSESIRMQTGLIPKKLGIVLPLALEGHSYHLEIAAPEGMYFYDLQTFMVEDSAKARNWTTFELPRRTRLEKLPRIYQFRQRGRKQLEHLKRSAQFYWRLLGSIAMNKTDAHIVASARRVRQLHSQSRFTWVAPGILGETPSLRTNDRGLGSAHVYARSVNDIRTKTLNTGAESNVVPQLRWELRERPPGILLPGLFLGVYVTTLVWTVSLVQEEVFGQCAPNTPQASAILFGVPAVLSAWVLSKFNGEHVERASGVSLFAVGWCVANAMITSLISLALIVKCQAWRYTIPRGWSWVLGDLSGHTLDRITWVILMLSTFCNLSLIIIMVIARIGRYAVRRDGTVDKLETISLYRKGK